MWMLSNMGLACAQAESAVLLPAAALHLRKSRLLTVMKISW
jgi:hypothetical protein